MPWLTTPRILACLMRKSPGRTAPSVAQATNIPAWALGAPQTICSGLVGSPVETVHTRSRSASGCFWASRILATTTPVKGGAADSISSTSRPAMVRRSAISSMLKEVSTQSRSQPSGTLMRTASESAGRSQKTSGDHQCHNEAW